MFKSIKLFPALTFGLFGYIFFHLAKEMLQVRSDGWYVGHVNLYGDLVFHLGLINKFLEDGKFIGQSPIYAGTKPDYPVFADFITAQISRLTSVDWALFITTFLVGMLGIYVARLFIKTFVKNEKVVFISLLLFFVNGGLGFTYLAQDFAKANTGIVDFLFNMPEEYTDIKEKGYWWINNYLAYFLPQRSFLFAFPVVLVVMLLLYHGTKRKNRSYFFFAGVFAGILPFIQAHSLFVLFLLSAIYAPATIYLAKAKKDLVKNWLIFAAVCGAIALPSLNAISSSGNVLQFVKFDPGFTSDENIIWFWFKNLGLFAPMLIASIIWIYKKNKHLFFLYLPFLSLFFLSNIFIFQPWEFDNTKIMIYWHFASCILVGYFMYEIFFSEGFAKKTLGTLIVFIMIFSGALDLFRTFTLPSSYQIFSNTDLQVGQAVKNYTPKDALFITASNHNHPIPALTGRTTLLGFHGWIWTHGLSYSQRARDIEEIYAGTDQSPMLISKYRISYVTIGPEERSTFRINENYFQQFPKIQLSANWVIYDVSNLWSNSNR